MLRVASVVVARHTPGSRRCLSTVTGRVKYFNRNKAYGFIIADENVGTDRDIFVHRNNIAGVTDQMPFGLPFLFADERVQFELSHAKDDKLAALNVKQEDGSLIPVDRRTYKRKNKVNVKRGFGEQVYDILDDDAMSEGDKVRRIMEEFEKARAQINELHAANHAQQGAASVVELHDVEEGEYEVETEATREQSSLAKDTVEIHGAN